jgi:NADH-quinone oxidoreductase subunit L
MTIPLVVLAVLSVLGGLLNLPEAIYAKGKHWMSHFLEHNVAGLSSVEKHEASNGETLMLMGIATLVFAVIFFVTKMVYVKKEQLPVEDSELKGWELASANKLYFDEIYNFLFVRPMEWLSVKGHQIIEMTLLNGIISTSAKTIERSGDIVKKIQTGKTDWYILWMVFGIVGLVMYYLLKF